MPYLKDNSGQAAVEYILTLAVMISIGAAVLGQLHDYLIASDSSFIAGTLGTFDQIFGGGTGGTFAFKRFWFQR